MFNYNNTNILGAYFLLYPIPFLCKVSCYFFSDMIRFFAFLSSETVFWKKVNFKAQQTIKSFELIYHIGYNKFIFRHFYIAQKHLATTYLSGIQASFSVVLIVASKQESNIPMKIPSFS